MVALRSNYTRALTFQNVRCRCVSVMDGIDLNTRTRALSLWVSFAVENLVYNTAPGVGAIQCQRETREADELKAVLRDWAQLTE